MELQYRIANNFNFAYVCLLNDTCYKIYRATYDYFLENWEVNVWAVIWKSLRYFQWKSTIVYVLIIYMLHNKLIHRKTCQLYWTTITFFNSHFYSIENVSLKSKTKLLIILSPNIALSTICEFIKCSFVFLHIQFKPTTCQWHQITKDNQITVLLQLYSLLQQANTMLTYNRRVSTYFSIMLTITSMISTN